MKNFIYSIPTKILFGSGMVDHVGREAVKLGKKVLLVYGKGSVKKSGLYDRVVQNLLAEGIVIYELGGVDPNPRLETVIQGGNICRENDIDFVLGMGGGSTIDCAKAIAVQAKYDGDLWKDLCTDKRFDLIKECLPVAAILTLAATGSEMNANSVISNAETNEKRGLKCEMAKPVFSILDPMFTYTVNKYHTAAGAIDIMSHIFEQYFSPEKDAFLQSRMMEGVLSTVIKYAPVALEEPANYEARANIMWAGTLALNGLMTYGKQSTDWATHLIEHELSAKYDITHGIGLGILTPYWMQYVLSPENVHRFVDYGKYVWGIEETDPMAAAEKAIQKTREFFTSIGCPATLREVGIDETKFEEMAADATYAGPIGSMKKLHKEDVIAIYKMAL